MDKDKFITETSAKIYAAMFAHSEKEPSTQVAIDSATKLWEQLIANGVDPHPQTPESNQIYI